MFHRSQHIINLKIKIYEKTIYSLSYYFNDKIFRTMSVEFYGFHKQRNE